jgi:hypothetical protein
MKKFLVGLLVAALALTAPIAVAKEIKLADHRNRMVMGLDDNDTVATTIIGTDTGYAKAKSMYNPMNPYLFTWHKTENGKWIFAIRWMGMMPVSAREVLEKDVPHIDVIKEGFQEAIVTTSTGTAFMVMTDTDSRESHLKMFNDYVWAEYYKDQRP